MPGSMVPANRMRPEAGNECCWLGMDLSGPAAHPQALEVRGPIASQRQAAVSCRTPIFPQRESVYRLQRASIGSSDPAAGERPTPDMAGCQAEPIVDQ